MGRGEGEVGSQRCILHSAKHSQAENKSLSDCVTSPPGVTTSIAQNCCPFHSVVTWCVLSLSKI